MSYSFSGLILVSHYLPIFISVQADTWGSRISHQVWKVWWIKVHQYVLAWIKESFEQCKIQSSDFNQLSADDAANSIGLISEYKNSLQITYPKNIESTVCLDHQNDCLIEFGSGTIKFTQPKNANLGALLYKSHKIQSSISHAPAHMPVYDSV